MELILSVNCDGEEGFVVASFLWLAIAMKAAKLLHSNLHGYCTTG
jgi:hypothetical protein